MNKQVFRVVMVLTVLVFGAVFFGTTFVSAQGGLTIEVRVNKDLAQPPAIWMVSDLTEVDRSTNSHGEWVELAHPQWENVFAVASEWDAITAPAMTSTPVPGAILPSATPAITTTLMAPATCGYRTGFTFGDAGQNVNSGFSVVGPAIFQIDGFNAVVIYNGANFMTTSNGVLWLYTGDDDCLNAQLQYFPGKNFTRVTP